MKATLELKAKKTNPQTTLLSEVSQFRRKGFLLIPSVIPREETKAFLSEVDLLVRKANKLGAVLRESYYHEASYKLIRVLRLTKTFDRLIDHPGFFNHLLELIGTHIQLMGSEIFVRGGAEKAITGFHTDLGAGLQHVLPHGDNPYLQIKAQIFLTDLLAPDSGNFALIPKSHLRRAPASGELCYIENLNRRIGPDGTLPRGSLQVIAKAGDVLLFPHTLWHAVAPNRHGRTRFSITLRYGQLALRPLERFDSILADAKRSLSPRQRRLLGDFGDDKTSPYKPFGQNEIMRQA